MVSVPLSTTSPLSFIRHGRGEDAFMTIETDEKIPRDLPQKILSLCPEIHDVRTV